MDDGERKIVNLKELAFLIGISDTALSSTLARHSEFPVINRGSNGVAYEFDADVCLAWWRNHQEARTGENEEHRRQLDMWRAELLGEQSADSDPKPSAKDQKAELELELLSDKLRRDRGKLVDRALVEHEFGSALATLRVGLLQGIGDYARSRSLDRADRLALEQMIRDRWNEVVRNLFGEGGEDERDLTKAA